jgi:hypothetical protein
LRVLRKYLGAKGGRDWSHLFSRETAEQVLEKRSGNVGPAAAPPAIDFQLGGRPLCGARQRARFRVPQVGYDIYVIPDDVLTIVLTFWRLDADLPIKR